MKRFLAIMLALIAAVCMFSGCGSDKGDDVNAPAHETVTPVTIGGNENDNAGGGANAPASNIVTPISDGGSFDGGGYE